VHRSLRLPNPSGRRFPPVDRVPPGSSRRLCYPMVTDPAAPPLRPERHIPHSIATMRRRLIAALVTAAVPLLLSTNGKTLATEDFMMQ
jgi:hypothetical protein